MAKEFKGNVLITGAGIEGAGGALAREFSRKGYRVFATARRMETILPLEEEFPGSVECVQMDVVNAEQIKEAKKKVEEITGTGRLDFLINNAGINYTMPALDCDIDRIRQTFEINVFGVMAVTQAFAPMLIKAQGKIVQIGSISAIMPYTFGSTYNASKAALHQYSNTLRQELAPFGVQVITIITGGMKSQIARYKYTLPSDSFYLPIDEYYQRRVTHSQESTSMPINLYAKSVVAHVLKPRPSAWYYEGYFARNAWFIDTFLPKWIWVRVPKRAKRVPAFYMYNLEELE